MAQPLERLDNLIDQLRNAIAQDRWEAVAQLAAQVQPAIEPVMAELAAGDTDPGVVQERLTELQSLCDQAQTGAEGYRAEALAALKGLSRTRAAARSYEDVSSRRNG
ncbi:MAG: SOS cell division inhibitor [Marinobacter sp.]|uniref:SOS cell division inhibitor n=1 Tax=Marinobacter sp. TaxID=50741 RepID=UPI00299EB882|nr:SOS cell division inhibitor [Marinobacter sp.]MDX1633461.1 SOS cell division inhibitor [Marinobacter sp.]